METSSSTTTRLSPTSRALPVSSTFHTVMGNGSALHHAAPLTVCTGTYNFPRAADTQSSAPHTCARSSHALQHHGDVPRDMEKGSSETHHIFLTSRATQDGSPKGAEHRSFTTCPISARSPALPRQLQGWNKATEKATSSSQCLCTESAPHHAAIPQPAATGQCPKPWAKGASHKQDPQPVNVFSGSCKSTWHKKGLRGRGKEGRPTTQHLALGSLMATATAQLLPAKGSRKNTAD